MSAQPSPAVDHLHDYRTKGISISTIVSFDVREANATFVWDANPTAMTSNKRAGRIVIEAYAHGSCGPIYVHGETIDQIADWFEQAAADIRARKGLPA